MINNKFQKIFDKLRKWNSGGERKLSNGTQLICHVPHIAPEAWFHEIYAPLTQNEVDGLEAQIAMKFPLEFRKFLMQSNGLNIFSDNLRILGKRTSYVREGDEAIQPYDLVLTNLEMKGMYPETWLYFGSYRWDGTPLIFDISNGLEFSKVYRCQRYSNIIIQEWLSFTEWLTKEVDRLLELFDLEGKPYDEDVPTVPSIE